MIVSAILSVCFNKASGEADASAICCGVSDIGEGSSKG